MNDDQYYFISGKKYNKRIDSRVLEEITQEALASGHRYLEIEAFGQHGIGGRLWKAGHEKIYVKITGYPGQRVGSFGFPNTCIEVVGPASDDVGWLNAGARIVVHGNAANGVANGMAQGKVYVAGNLGARAMTMTKHNPRFEPPELWVLGSVGDYFGEFMAGGITVVCGFEAQTPANILGYRPLVGMVGGKVFFRGPHKGFSQADAKIVPIEEESWQWLLKNLKIYLEAIKRPELFENLSDPGQWQLLVVRTPQEKMGRRKRSMESFRTEVWDQELGTGGLIGDLTDLDKSPIALITTGHLRRFVPVWENRKYVAPCEATCPTGIPIQERWRLIREGRVDEAVDLALAYTPFPATVCGYLCPNLCVQSCTRQSSFMTPVDVQQLGKASIAANLPELPPESGKRIAVIGGGPAGISVAWQLRQGGHYVTVYDMAKRLGGKITAVVPDSRVPEEIVNTELARVKKVLPHVHLQQRMERKEVEQLREDVDFLVIATGAQKPIILPVPGMERAIPALDFLVQAKAGKIKVGKRLVIIGAGNVGCDVATEAHRLGAEKITLIDIQEPLSFGKERQDAEAVGAVFKWPCFTEEISPKGVKLTTGEIIPADIVVISIGDRPDLEFLPEDVATERGFIVVDEFYQTTDPKLFAIGDVVRPGLLTDAIGAGRKVAEAINGILQGRRLSTATRQMIDHERMTVEYFDPRITSFKDVDQCGSECLSCGACRDCGICVTLCPQAALSRQETENKDFEIVVDESRCIGCGFCANACPCGIWDLVENEPLE
ncbi:MAG: FAD-dependent oxidoreductase [Desulfobacterales bacterium]|uniref:FAD-dependent oxidoreductase n=1 Tax=Candidatus Desulfatibia vada TaxID=2841696 RepID=A0A8J6P0K5_9BACT|nr:FAD-dependent oxidoreductase [Candidatus Desulfatibia vada]